MHATHPQLGTTTGSESLEDGIREAARQGARWVELACQHPANRPGEIEQERATRLSQMLADHELAPIVHTDSAVNTAELFPGIRDAVRRHMDDYIALCERLGATRMIVHAGLAFGDNTLEALDASITMLTEWARSAEASGITLTLENMNILSADAEIRYLGTTAGEVGTILDAVGSRALQACVDIGHAHLLPGGALSFIQALAGRIGHAQLTDNDGSLDSHLALGAGTLDLDEALRALSHVGYNGPICIELDDPHARRTSVGVLNDALRKV